MITVERSSAKSPVCVLADASSVDTTPAKQKCEWADSINLRRARQIFAGVTNALYQAVVTVDLEGTVAKKLRDPYNPEARWHKILNRDYSSP